MNGRYADSYLDAEDIADYEASLGGRWAVVQFFDRANNFVVVGESEAHAILDRGADAEIQYVTGAE